MESSILVRAEEDADRALVHALNVSAFDGAAEANLVESLRAQAKPIISLVAELGGDVVGHILFSPVTLSGHPSLMIMGLAPMAVAPAQQGRGIGTALVREGLRRCRALGAGAVVVLGHPGYYPRFGFAPAARFGLDCEYDVPDDVFMICELARGFLDGASGTIRYHPAFKEA